MPTKSDLEPLASDYIQLIYNAFCFFLGFPLNLVTLIRLVYRFHKTQSRIFLMHINLNITDLMVLLFYCFGRVCWLLTYQWVGGGNLCKLMRFLESFSFSISSNIVVCIAMDRAHLVLWPLRASSEINCRIAGMISLAWLLALIVASPQIFIWSVYSATLEDGKPFSQCVTTWTIKIIEQTNTTQDALDNKHYQIAYLVVIFWIPFFLLVISYIIILNSIFRNFSSQKQAGGYYFTRLRQIVGRRIETAESQEQEERSENVRRVFVAGEEHRQSVRSRTLKVAMILVTVYMVCWLPYNTLGWWTIIDPGSFKKIEDSVYFLLGMVVLNSVINPFVYGRFQMTNCCPTSEEMYAGGDNDLEGLGLGLRNVGGPSEAGADGFL